MAMGLFQFRFVSRPDEAMFRERLRREVGRRRARAIDLEWSDDAAGGGMLGVLSQSGVALAYAAKVAEAMGGVRVPLIPSSEIRPLPSWTATPWVELPWLVRARIWWGPTRV
jgi:hypothetical protein